MRAKRSFIMLAACLSLLGSAVACSGGGGNPLASDDGGTDVNAPARDTTGFMVGNGR